MTTGIVEPGEARHPIRVVSERTGLSPDVLRAWEKRYRAVEPPRRDGGSQRLYSDADVERLRLLRAVTQAGRGIGQVAGLATAELAAMARDDEAARRAAPCDAPRSGRDEAARSYVDRCLAYAHALDANALESVLMRGLVALGVEGFVDDVAVAFLREIGRGWSERTIGIAQEHLACATLRRVLGFAADAAAVPGDAPMAVIATPARHVHEMGALLAAVSAAAAGWQITYLGADIPAEEIAAAARQKNAAVVALSVVNPGEELAFAEELRMLRAHLPPRVGVMVGGSGACVAPELLAEADAVWLPTLADFRHALRALALDAARHPPLRPLPLRRSDPSR